jgi:hypothetical protein
MFHLSPGVDAYVQRFIIAEQDKALASRGFCLTQGEVNKLLRKQAKTCAHCEPIARGYLSYVKLRK